MPFVSTFIAKSQELKELDSKYPAPVRPVGKDFYTFPVNADDLSDSEMEDWLVYFGAWRGYMGYLISKVESELYILSEGFDVLLSTKVAVLEANAGKKFLKDSLKGQALSEDLQLQELKLKIIDSNGELKLLKGRLSLYDSGFETISRVVTRRGQDRFKI